MPRRRRPRAQSMHAHVSPAAVDADACVACTGCDCAVLCPPYRLVSQPGFAAGACAPACAWPATPPPGLCEYDVRYVGKRLHGLRLQAPATSVHRSGAATHTSIRASANVLNKYVLLFFAKPSTDKQRPAKRARTGHGEAVRSSKAPVQKHSPADENVPVQEEEETVPIEHVLSQTTGLVVGDRSYTVQEWLHLFCDCFDWYLKGYNDEGGEEKVSLHWNATYRAQGLGSFHATGSHASSFKQVCGGDAQKLPTLQARKAGNLWRVELCYTLKPDETLLTLGMTAPDISALKVATPPLCNYLLIPLMQYQYLYSNNLLAQVMLNQKVTSTTSGWAFESTEDRLHFFHGPKMDLLFQDSDWYKPQGGWGGLKLQHTERTFVEQKVETDAGGKGRNTIAAVTTVKGALVTPDQADALEVTTKYSQEPLFTGLAFACGIELSAGDEILSETTTTPAEDTCCVCLTNAVDIVLDYPLLCADNKVHRCMCNECLSLLVTRAPAVGKIRCPLCRSETPAADVRAQLEVAKCNFWQVSVFQTFLEPRAQASMPVQPGAHAPMPAEDGMLVEARAQAVPAQAPAAPRVRRVLLQQVQTPLYGKVKLIVPKGVTFQIEADFVLPKPTISRELKYSLPAGSQLTQCPRSCAAAAVERKSGFEGHDSLQLQVSGVDDALLAVEVTEGVVANIAGDGIKFSVRLHENRYDVHGGDLLQLDLNKRNGNKLVYNVVSSKLIYVTVTNRMQCNIVYKAIYVDEHGKEEPKDSQPLPIGLRREQESKINMPIEKEYGEKDDGFNIKIYPTMQNAKAGTDEICTYKLRFHLPATNT